MKNAYYKNSTELETLPNIDINIKCGNSLVSRFAIDSDLRQALKKSKQSIEDYKRAVDTYRNAESKDQKREMERLISDIKSDFRSEISINDPKVKKLKKLSAESFQMTNQGQLFEMSKKEKSEWNKKLQQLSHDISKLEEEIEEIKANKIYENAFEWRFEFPEVLNNDGDYLGFDAIIGNPPYIPLEAFNAEERQYFNNKYHQLERKYETSVTFILEGLNILNETGLLAYIAPVTWQTGENYSKFRKHLFEKHGVEKLINLPFNIFEDAYVDTALYFITKEIRNDYSIFVFDKKAQIKSLGNLLYNRFQIKDIATQDYKMFLDPTAHKFSRFNSEHFIRLGMITKSTQGLSGSNFPETNESNLNLVYPFLAKGNVYNYCLTKELVYHTDLSNKKNLIQFYQKEPKVLIRRIISRQDRLSVTYCDERIVFKKDINPFIPTDIRFDCLFLTGLLASKLLSFIYLNTSAIAKKDDFRQTTLSELRNLLIPIAPDKQQQAIAQIVKSALDKKKVSIDANTSDLEDKIDQLVYKLYNLTPEEVRIVENKEA